MKKSRDACSRCYEQQNDPKSYSHVALNFFSPSLFLFPSLSLIIDLASLLKQTKKKRATMLVHRNIDFNLSFR